MMNKHCRLVWLLLVIGLVACAGAEKVETLNDLDELNIKIDVEAPILGARDKAMDNYWEVMADTKDVTQKVEAMRRLADLEMERSEERLQKQMELLDQGKADDDVDLQSLKENAYRGAIKLYEDALKASGSGPQSAELFYQLSKAYEQAGDQKKALGALHKLLLLNPDAANHDELQFRRGELLFDLRQFNKAGKAYSLAMQSGEKSPYYEKALTKRSWALFKQDQYQRSIQSFFEFADRKLDAKPSADKLVKTKLSRGDKELVDDVFRIVILAFNELGGPEAITRHFKTHGHRDYEPRVYREMAEYYIDKERVRDAAAAYLAFAEIYPMHEQAFEFDQKAIKAYESNRFASLLMDAKQVFIRRYRVNGPYWKRYEDQENTILAKLGPMLRRHSEDVVRHFHAQAQKIKSPKNYQTAFTGYRKHLKWFGQDENAQELNFLFAELLFEAEQFESAVKEYEKTAYRYLRFGRDSEAGYAALLAYAELENRASGKQKKTWRRLAVGSALRFGKAFPDDKRTAGVLTKSAQDMFALKKYNQAAVAARQILELSEGPQSNTRLIAWKIIARAEFEKGDYTRAEVAYKIALSLVDKNNNSRKSLEDGLAAAVYKQGEYMKSKGNLQAAIVQFSRVKQVSPNSTIIVSAEFDIAASLMAAKRWAMAIKKLSDFRAAYPDHPLNETVTDNLAKAYLETDQYQKAAEEFEKISLGGRDREVKRSAAWQAAELYEKAGEQSQVIASYKRYVDMFPSPLEQATEARSKLATIYGEANDVNNRRLWLNNIVRSDRNGRAESTQRTRYLAAKAAFELAQPALRSFQQVKLVRPLKVNLKRKKQRMQTALKAYTLAADYGIAEVTTASVYWLAEIYNEFGQELMDSERPPGLSADELEQYDILLEEQAYPFEEKSINIHESNVGRVGEGAYNEWIKKSFDKLRKLSPIRYSKSEKSESFAQLIY
jgi:tetratricopeptide (TPR) repeat protein